MNNSADRVKVLILTKNYRIEGEIAHFKDARLTDYMVAAKLFLAVTDAKVMTPEGRELFTTSFLNVHRDSVEVILPAELAKINC